jgi:hypothetical protein
MRIPLYIGIPEDTTFKDAFPDVSKIKRLSFSDRAFKIQRGKHSVCLIGLGNGLFDGRAYRISLVLTIDGDQRRVYRWLKSKEEIAGPYTRSSAPPAIRRFIGSLRDDGRPVTPVVIFGDRREDLDALRYREGTDPAGELDEIV